MFCDNCGAKIPDGSRYCGACGKDLSDRVGKSYVPKDYNHAWDEAFGADHDHYEHVQERREEHEWEEYRNGGFAIIITLSIILLVCAFVLPAYSFYEGLFPDRYYAWTVGDTFETFVDEGMEAFDYRPVIIHFWTWVAGAGLLISALCKSKVFSIISAIVGIVMPATTVVNAVRFLGFDFLSLSDGCLGAGYYFPLILFIVSICIAAKHT